MSTITDSRITEASGMTYSKRWPGHVYINNDEDGAIYMVRLYDGKVVGSFTIAGAHLSDPEALALDKSANLIVADIGDNDSSRSSVSLYQLPEPGPGVHRPIKATRHRLTYPDGPHNAETLLINPITQVRHIITKGSEARIYRLPDHLSPSSRNQTIGLGTRKLPYVSDAVWNLSGTHVFARLKGQHDKVRVLNSGLSPVDWIPVPSMSQPESITLELPDGDAIWFGSEGKNSPLARVPLPTRYQ